MITFLDHSLHDFIAREGGRENLWVFVHIPKTAGTSFSFEMAKELSPYYNIHVDYENPEIPYEVQLQGAVDGFIEKGRTIQFCSASGHISIGLAAQIRQAIPSTKLITFLREPVARVISDFRYQRTPAHPPHKEFIEQFPTLTDYAQSPDAQNKMFRFLARDPASPLETVLKEMEEDFTFVGLVEMYPMSFNLMFRLFGASKLPVEHRRKTETNDFNIYEDSPELRGRIRKLNELDMALFEHFRDILVRKRDEWNELRTKQ